MSDTTAIEWTAAPLPPGADMDCHQQVVVNGKGNHPHEWPTEMPREYL